MTATVILLNGVGSVGKSSICRVLQSMTRTPFYHVQMDHFWDMMPAQYFGHPDGAQFVETSDDGAPAIEIQTGSVAQTLLAGMRASVTAMAAEGCDLIVDDVLFGNIETKQGNPVQDYRDRLAAFQTHWVGIYAPLSVIEQRERLRGDRRIGLARWQYHRVHLNMDYDLEIEVGDITAEAAAKKIKDQFDL